MAATLSPAPKLQFFDNAGQPLAGGKLYTYAAGTTTPQVTYTSSAASANNPNPIILDSRGEAEIWFGTLTYKFKLTTSADVEIWTVDNIKSDAAEASAAITAALAASNGATLIGYQSQGTGSVARTVSNKLQENLSVFDFAGTSPPASGADWTAIIQTADTAASSLNKALYFPAYTYGISNAGVLRSGCDWIGEEPQKTIIKALPQSFSNAINYSAMIACVGRDNVRTTGLAFNFAQAIVTPATTAVVTASVSAGQTGEGYVSGAVAPVMTVTAVTSGTLAVGQPISGTGIDISQFILALGTGTGGVGTYKLGIAQASAVASGTISQQTNGGNVVCALQMWLCNNWTVENCRFTGIQTNIIGLAVNGGNDWAVRRNYFNMAVPTNRYNQAINVSESAGSVRGYEISGNNMYGTGVFSNGSGGTISNNYITGVKFGAAIALGPLSTCIFNIITNNQCYLGQGFDINTTFVSGIENWSAYSVIANNTCYSNSGHGISNGNVYVSVANNFCLSNGTLNGDGICLYSGGAFVSSYCSISGNLCTDNQAIKTQKYGLSEYNVSGGGIYSNVITGNVLNGNKLGTTLLNVGNGDGFVGPVLSTPITAGTPGTIAAGGFYYVSDIFTYEAALGDVVTASYDKDLQGCTLTAYVSAANNVNFTVYNGTGSSRTLAAGNFRGAVMKRPGYVGAA